MEKEPEGTSLESGRPVAKPLQKTRKEKMQARPSTKQSCKQIWESFWEPEDLAQFTIDRIGLTRVGRVYNLKITLSQKDCLSSPWMMTAENTVVRHIELAL